MNEKKSLILMVEDEEQVLNTNCRMLRRRGYDVRIAQTAAEACHQLEEYLPDLLILDIMLPDGNGLDICRRFVELLCRKNLLLVFCKETQQREFGPGKACVGIIEICMAVRKIQPQAADGDLTGGLKFFFYFFFHSFLAFQKHLDHGQKFIEIIRITGGTA